MEPIPGGEPGRSLARGGLEALGGSHTTRLPPLRDASPSESRKHYSFQGYENKVLPRDIAEIEYQPLKCSRPYRLIIVRKNISVQKGEQVLFDEIRYFFYITNRVDYTGEQIVSLANGRCDQENVIEQLKNGVNAMRMPVDDLLSNSAYMVMTALAWNLKAWFGLLLPNRERGAGVCQDGVPAFPARDPLAARADRAHGQTLHLPHHEL